MVRSRGEASLYPVVAEYFKRQEYDVRIDSPKGSGIKFDLLKGWTIDVVAMKPTDEGKNLVAVEVKNKVSPMSILQAISQAEIYQNACTKVYIAFPMSEWEKEENTDAVREVKELCQSRGIGILKIGSLGLRQPCIEELPPITSLRLDVYQGIVKQFAEKVGKFEGFGLDDFHWVLLEDPSYNKLVRKKLRMLLDSVSERLPISFKRKLKYHNLGKSGFWGYLLEEKNQAQYTHFNFSIHSDEFTVGIVSETKRPITKIIQNISDDKEGFLKILKGIEGATFRLWKRTPTGLPRQFDWEIVISFQTDYANASIVDFVLGKLNSLKYTALRLYFSYWAGQEDVQSAKLIDEVANDIEILEPFYSFARR
jgi:hypothetical protein